MQNKSLLFLIALGVAMVAGSSSGQAAQCKASGKKTFVVSAADFQDKLASAHPGDTIILKPGNYGTLTVDKGGATGNPIHIAAMNLAVDADIHPDLHDTSNVGLLTMQASNVTVCGILFDDTAYKSIRHAAPANNVAYMYNYFKTKVHNEMAVEMSIDTWSGGTGLIIENNYFNATRNNTYSQDYGVGVFNYNNVYIRNNIFNGVFNHAVSLKRSVENAYIEDNTFRGCGQVCIHVGQTQDFTGEEHNTGGQVTIKGNKFIEDYTTHPQSANRKGMVLRNQEDIIVRDNTFQGAWTRTIATDFDGRGGLEELKGRKLGIWNNKQEHILIEGNRFSNAKLDFSGRGTGRKDHINLHGNAGAFSCSVSEFKEADDKQYVWSTIDRQPPTVTGCP